MSTQTDETRELIIDVHGLKKYYGDIKAVDGIAVQIPKGQIFGFLGPNGAGKSTTINTLITLLKPTEGTGTVAGFDLRDVVNIRKVVGAVFQEQTLDETLTAIQNLRLHAEMYRIPKDVREQRIKELTEMVGLSERLNDAVISFSGGMRRRLEIARGLLTEPEILFLDEPTIGLDPQSRANIHEKIKDMNKNHGITIFLTTHDMGEAETLCDYIYIIDKGKIIAKGTADELKGSLGNDFIILEFKDEAMVEEARELAAALESVNEIKVSGSKLHIGTKNGSHSIAAILDRIHSDKAHLEIVSVELKKPSLNDVFLYYTGKDFRDSDADLADRMKMIGRKARPRRGMRGH